MSVKAVFVSNNGLAISDWEKEICNQSQLFQSLKDSGEITLGEVLYQSQPGEVVCFCPCLRDVGVGRYVLDEEALQECLTDIMLTDDAYGLIGGKLELPAHQFLVDNIDADTISELSIVFKEV